MHVGLIKIFIAASHKMSALAYYSEQPGHFCGPNTACANAPEDVPLQRSARYGC